MKLNPVELTLINNPLRTVLLRSTVGWLHDAACAPALERVLEIGCGQGEGVREMQRWFRPRAIDAFDLDEAQVARARTRLADVEATGVPLRLWVGDAERIDAPDGTYDAVMELTILHHVPDWRPARSPRSRGCSVPVGSSSSRSCRASSSTTRPSWATSCAGSRCTRGTRCSTSRRSAGRLPMPGCG